MDALAGETLYVAAGNPATLEWTDLARRLFAGRGIEAAAQFPEIAGEEEFVRVVRKRGWSVLASTDFMEVPGMVVRPLTAPVPLAPVSMVWREGFSHPGLGALRRVAEAAAARHGWLKRPPKAGCPSPTCP